MAMDKRRKRKSRPARPEREGPRDRPLPNENKRLAAQTRKILGKHYMSRYRVR
jgi:hypothetical protein